MTYLIVFLSLRMAKLLSFIKENIKVLIIKRKATQLKLCLTSINDNPIFEYFS